MIKVQDSILSFDTIDEMHKKFPVIDYLILQENNVEKLIKEAISKAEKNEEGYPIYEVKIQVNGIDTEPTKFEDLVKSLVNNIVNSYLEKIQYNTLQKLVNEKAEEILKTKLKGTMEVLDNLHTKLDFKGL